MSKSSEYDLITKVSLQLNDFDKGIGDLTKKVNQLQQQFKKTGSKGKQDLTSITDEINNITSKFGGLIPTIGAAMAVSSVVTFASECSKVAEQAEGIEIAFNKLNVPYLLADIRKQLNGTLDDMSIMKSLVNAKNFGVPLEQMGTLLKFAGRVAQETGGNVQSLADTIVTSIGRKSTLILDNFGITATQVKEKLGGMSVEAATTSQLAAAVAEIANERYKDLNDTLETSRTATSQLNAEWANTKVGIGNLLNKAVTPFKKALINIVDALKTFSQAQRDNIQVTSNMNNFMKQSNYSTLSTAEKIKSLNYQISAQSELLNDEKNEIKDLRKEYDALGIMQFSEKKKIENRVETIRNNITQNTSFIESLTKMRDELNQQPEQKEIINNKKVTESIVTIDTLNKKIEETTELLNGSQVGSSAFVKYSNQLKSLNSQLEKAKGFSKVDKVERDKTKVSRISSISGGYANIGNSKASEQTNIDKLNKSLKEFVDNTAKAQDSSTKLGIQTQETLNNIKVEKINNINDALYNTGDAFRTIGNAMNSSKGNWIAWVGSVIQSIPQLISQIASLVAANEANAIAGAVSSSSGLAYPYNLFAIASSIAATVAALATSVPKKNKFADGGIIANGSFSGDMVQAYLNKGEMILNSSQQGKLWNMINTDSSFNSNNNSHVEFEIKGDRLVGVLNNHSKKNKYGR